MWVSRELNPGPLEEQPVLLILEPSLLLLLLFFEVSGSLGWPWTPHYTMKMTLDFWTSLYRPQLSLSLQNKTKTIGFETEFISTALAGLNSLCRPECSQSCGVPPGLSLQGCNHRCVLLCPAAGVGFHCADVSVLSMTSFYGLGCVLVRMDWL